MHAYPLGVRWHAYRLADMRRISVVGLQADRADRAVVLRGVPS